MEDFLKTVSLLQRMVDSGDLNPAYESVVKLAIGEIQDMEGENAFMREMITEGIVALQEKGLRHLDKFPRH